MCSTHFSTVWAKYANIELIEKAKAKARAKARARARAMSLGY
jgi:hypothetical protein